METCSTVLTTSWKSTRDFMLEGTEKKVSIFKAYLFSLRTMESGVEWFWLCSGGSQNETKPYWPSLVWPFQQEKGSNVWKRVEDNGICEFYEPWFQAFALLSSREIKDKTLHEIFITLILISAHRMTIKTLHRWIISQEPVTRDRRRLTQWGKIRVKGWSKRLRKRREGEKMLIVQWRRRGLGLLEASMSERQTPQCVSSEICIKQNNSHVKAQVLLLLKEVVQNVLPDKVWV